MNGCDLRGMDIISVWLFSPSHIFIQRKGKRVKNAHSVLDRKNVTPQAVTDFEKRVFQICDCLGPNIGYGQSIGIASLRRAFEISVENPLR